MIPHFTEAEKAVHYPVDRRAYLGMSKYTKMLLLVLCIGIFGAAWLQYLVFGLPETASAPFYQYDRVNLQVSPCG